jgi:small subunit ribosomal protein S17
MKNMRGRVVSNKAMKTATVLVETHKTHPLYGKSYIQTKKFLVDDQIGVAIGDIVEFVKTRPISKLKHWQIVKVIGRDIVAVESQVMKEAAKEAIEEVLPVPPRG